MIQILFSFQYITEIINPNADCNEYDCDCSSGNDFKSPIKVTMTNETVGTLMVSFRIVEDRIYQNYIEVILKVNNTLNETECHKEGNDFEELMRRRLFLKKCGNNNYSCDKATDTVVVNFTNLHTACYQVEIRHKRELINYLKDRPVVSCPKFFVTGHAHPIDKSKVFEPVTLGCQILEDRTLHINVQPQIKGSTDPNQYKSRMVYGNDIKLFSPNMSNFRILENGMLMYQYDSLKPGNYCHVIRHQDGRCLLLDSCNEECLSSHVIIIPETQTTANEVPLDRTPSLLFLITGIILPSVTVIISVIYIVLKAYHRFPMSWFVTNNNADESLSLIPLSTAPRKKILLLYPRDCPLFMETMDKLRSIFCQNGFEVFDVWDPALTEKIRSDPMSVLQREVVNVATTTIVVESQCSKLFSDQYEGNITVHYQKPEEFDNLFLYGLKYVIENFQKKSFVIRLSDQASSDDFQVFGINILEKYILPLHLERLILNIRRVRGIAVQAQLNGTEEIDQLKALVNELSEYKKRNPNYLLDELISVMPL
ncbi:hypothetical protein LSTR_LSTR012286 [Laodelphax striatellus]|uniref:SEFIR domain-containing protein n=2 Tax=Laodelphax striatellus TaxID=195883 RepID=A0A482WLP3_LAOST|nr:hypothetical protein LSTR_LSTR012286 [Laodelphax striatellus]